MDTRIKYRHELKYQCSDLQLAVIKSRLSNLMRYDTHAKNGSYKIRSMYFDNYENRCYYENESGTDPREKFRIRIYNSSNRHISFECKRKERGKTYKTSCLLSKEQFAEIINEKRITVFANKPELLRKFIILKQTQLFKPAVIVEYDRTPYVYDIGNVRITLDRNIRSSNDYTDFFSDSIVTKPILPQGQHLLEVKYDELLPDFIKDVLQLGNLQQTTFSKYYLCRKHSVGGLL